MTPDTSPKRSPQAATDAKDIAKQFVAARRAATPLKGFPGKLPGTLADAYRCQDEAIRLWDEPVGGWKVGRIPPQVEEQFQCDRLAGPIFESMIFRPANGQTQSMPIFVGGFAAVEAEFVAVIAKDAPAGKTSWTTAEAEAMIGDLRIGLEVASSPLATINEIGPLAVVSDFGNNAGLLIGPSLPDWRNGKLELLTCDMYVEEDKVGSGGAFLLTGGFVRSVQFMLELAAERGRPLQAGALVATGQTTGIHDVEAGQRARVTFAGAGTLDCVMVAARGS